MNDNKVEAMQVARRFDKDFFDGSRRYGYGGYKYDGRWKPMAEKLIKRYNLDRHSRILDLGCGMGHLSYELEQLIDCRVDGVDISKYAADESMIKTEVADMRKDPINYTYDLILAINVLHNFTLPELRHVFDEINFHSRMAYIVVDSYRNEQELTNLQCWALTAEQFLRPEEWEFLFRLFNYRGDWEPIFYE
jgi:SAM-dependent methyltransferase